MCPLKVRVGANSPSLCPTMPSVMNTGTCLRPSCTAIVWPTMSGMIVERRDHVLMTRFSRLALSASTLRSRCSSTNGPFFRLRGMLPPCLAPRAARAPAPDDQPVGVLVAAPSPSLRLAPGRHRVAAARALALAPAEGVVDRVHRHPARLGAHPTPAVAPRLADRHELRLGVADDADRRPAVDRDPPHLRRRQPQRGEGALLRHDLHAHPGAARQLPAAARPQLDVVDDRADGDVADRQRVAWPDLRALAGLEDVADADLLGREDVALLPVRVVQQGDPSVAVRVVLDGSDARRYPVLVAPEVDDPVPALVAAAPVARRLAPVAVASAARGQRRGERALRAVLRDLGEVRDRLEPPSGARRPALAHSHPGSSALEQLDAVPAGEADDGPLRVGAPAVGGGAAVPLALALAHERVDARDAHRERPLDGLADLHLRRSGVDDEDVGPVVHEPVGLLRDHRAQQHRPLARHAASPPGSSSGAEGAPAACPVAAPSSGTAVPGRVASVNTTTSAPRTSYALSWSAGTVTTWRRLAKERRAASSARSSTTSTLPEHPRAPSAATASFVRGTANPQRSTRRRPPAEARAESAQRRAWRTIFFGVRWA